MSLHGGVIRARNRDIVEVIQKSGVEKDGAFKLPAPLNQPAMRVIIRRILAEDITLEISELFPQRD
jgi:hypothetical protein